MEPLRILIRRYHSLALMLALSALAMKAILPSGYMIGPSSTMLTVQICADGAETMTSSQIEIPLDRKSQNQPHENGKGAASCAFSSLSLAGLSATDAAQLCLALRFILLLGLVPAPRLARMRVARLRPPLRGPPAAA